MRRGRQVIERNRCCFKCAERRAGCHGTCERYLAWKAAAEAEKEKIKSAKRDYKAADDYQHAAAARLRKMK